MVPRPDFCTFVAGRSQLRDDIAFLLQSLSRRDTSSIHVFWSWLGAGKTHALYYLAHEARRITTATAPIALLPVYTEFPKKAGGFIDLYRAMVPNLGISGVVDAFLEVSTSGLGDRFQEELQTNCPDFAAALRVLAIERDAQRRATATRWLRADKLPLSEFRHIGISQRLETSDQAVIILATIVRLLIAAAKLRGGAGVRVLWLLDEFQRLDRTGRAVPDVNAGLHSLFNACPVGLSQIISFSGPPKERSLPECFSKELRDRIGTTKVMVLPPLQRDEAITFIREVLEHYRDGGRATPSPFFPFTERSCKHVIDFLRAKTELRPRALMHAFNAVLEVADPKIQSGEIDAISPGFCDSALAHYVVLTDEDEGQEEE